MQTVDPAPAVDDAPREQAVDERPAARSLPMPKVLHRLASVNSRKALTGLVVLVLLALTLAVPTRTYLSQRAEFNRLAAENAQLEREVAHYQRRVTELNDPAYIENQARERLQYVMRGEKPLVLSYPAREKEAAAQQQAREYEANPWYQNLWDAVSTPPEDK
ncbi:hypothetical protein GOHSU_38_00210 [Gordonia hirsuta DSM 44140 = NBRC 16056]|uniref:Septum formation initiator family protein n=1 Tax=Gordonia hirsuta DSM 44140 = NBRC 16056 TaxID=1121927 RepID=L7LE87_9ACTN|nr:septum formation initiator family protein [Gordonia hirsuta]GAC58382.1 hypothetical protein GOHSU_38_00210 [Gordonia hirsuta DSM 44140 = NBRC 16056]